MEMSEKSEDVKQKHERMDEPQQKQRMLGESENSNDVQANAVEAKSITNIYYDCLERIFDFLDIESLLMVANTCKRLQIAAAAKFGDEHGNKHVQLDPRLHQLRPSVHLNYGVQIWITGLKLCLPFLRCFGGKITNLFVSHRFDHQSKYDYLDRYINQYCADTLTDITICCKLKFSSETFGKPFKNVEYVALYESHLSGGSLANCVTWFPKMRHLIVFWCTIADTSMNVHFPHLERLVLDMRKNRADNDQCERAMNILQSNPQLQSLEITPDFELTLNTLLNKIRENSTITKLNVNIAGTTDVNANELERFVAEHPLIVELILNGYRLTADDAIRFAK